MGQLRKAAAVDTRQVQEAEQMIAETSILAANYDAVAKVPKFLRLAQCPPDHQSVAQSFFVGQFQYQSIRTCQLQYQR